MKVLFFAILFFLVLSSFSVLGKRKKQKFTTSISLSNSSNASSNDFSSNSSRNSSSNSSSNSSNYSRCPDPKYIINSQLNAYLSLQYMSDENYTKVLKEQ